MKKFTLFLLMTALLSSIFAIGVSAEQTNMEVKVPRLAGRPVFDGSITEAEWGKKTIRMVTEGAATTDSEEIGCNEELGLMNTFYYYAVEGLCDTLAYDLWIRWDDDYLYVAAIVDDPDPFSLNYDKDEIWCGDCIQIRVDERGPSAIMLASDPYFNYKTDAFNGNRFKKPWSSDKEVFNGIMGMVKGSTPTFWRCGKTYGEGWNLKNDGGLVGINVKRNSDDTCTITYEGAIPWKAVNKTLIPKAGDVYGMGVSVYCSDSNDIGGMLQWGSGIGFVEEQPRSTRGGSQAILLTNEKVGGNGGGTVVEPSFTKYGDANGDGSITLTDASTILKHIAKWSVSINTKASDVTNDGNTTLSDVSRILQYIAKWNVTLGPSDDDTIITADNLLQNIQGYWVHRSHNGYNYVYHFISFNENNFGGGMYCSEPNRPGIIKNVKDIGNRKYELHIVYPKYQQYEELLPESKGTATILSTDNFKANLTTVNSKGEHIKWVYAGETIDECMEMMEALFNADNT